MVVGGDDLMAVSLLHGCSYSPSSHKIPNRKRSGVVQEFCGEMVSLAALGPFSSHFYSRH